MFKYFVLSALVLSIFALEGVVELTDSNFKDLVESQPKFWLVMFSASWCGHCTHLKPEIEKLAPMLQKLGVSVGHVGQSNSQLVDRFVVDHSTHMVSYPKLKVFLGSELLGDVPSGLRNAIQIQHWFKNEYQLSEIAETQTDGQL